MTDLIVHPQRTPLRGIIAAPADRAAIELAMILSQGLDLPAGSWHVRRLDTAVALLAASAGAASADVEVTGPAGRAAFETMARVAAALRQRGADIEGTLDPSAPRLLMPPYRVGRATAPLAALTVTSSDPWVKLAALVSGVFADGATVIAGPWVRHDVVEKMLAAMGAPLSLAGPIVQLDGHCELRPIDGPAPGDPALSAVLLAAGLGIEGSVVGVRHMALTRAGLVDALRRAGCVASVETRGDRLGVACGDVLLRAGGYRALNIGGEQAYRIRAAIPTVAAIAAGARGTSRIDTAGAELRWLRAFGINAAFVDGSLHVTGATPRAAQITATDPNVAMAATALALRADGPSTIRQVDAIMESFPRFVGSLRAFGARIEVVTK